MYFDDARGKDRKKETMIEFFSYEGNHAGHYPTCALVLSALLHVDVRSTLLRYIGIIRFAL